MGRHQRLTALRRVLDHDAAPLRSRAAAALVLLFAQPLTRIVCLTTDDILDDGQQVHLRLGAPPLLLPEPVADLVRDYLRSLPAHTPAVNLSTHWLFPVRRPGQPVNTSTLRDALRDLGIPNQRARTSAIRHLVLRAPAPVIAKALGYHDKTATRLVTEAGGTWADTPQATTHGDKTSAIPEEYATPQHAGLPAQPQGSGRFEDVDDELGRGASLRTRLVSRRSAPCAYQVTDAQRWLRPPVSRCLR